MMKLRLRSKAVAVAAILAGVALALFTTSGPAVAFFSGGLFLDAHAESPATLVDRGAAVDVTVDVTCNATDFAFVSVTVTQRSGSGIAQGGEGTQVACLGSSERIVVRVTARGDGKPFKQGTATATADIFGCSTGVCGEETNTETIAIQR